ncbi:MAG: trypsin-like peptidase domain-containing protein [Clostridia bacterium]|nr:trypsin-like peptidase domain-containing protein [Clostridia bacterium]
MYEDNNSNYVSPASTKRGRIFLIILVAFLSLALGASAGIAGVGYFLAVNDVDVRSIIMGNYDPGQGVQTEEIVKEVIKRVEVVDSTTGSPVAAIAEKVIPSIVSIRITYPYTYYFFNTEREGVGEGSGIIISDDGYILTNNHVIEAALQANSNVKYESATIKVFISGRTDEPFEAEVVGRDEVTDLALLKIEADGLIAIEIGDSDKLSVGDLAVAVGNPGGMMYMGSVTCGIISGLNREVYDQDSGQQDDEKLNLIQTDAAINPGNSGGALVDATGKLIGINTLKIVSTGYEGLGFAIPVNNAMEIVEELKTQGFVSRGRPNIGIAVSSEYDSAIAAELGLPEGVLVTQVGGLTPAEAAGLMVNDIITEINGVRVKTFDELLAEKNKYSPGDVIDITVYRQTGETGEDGEYLEIPLTLGEANY